MTTGGAKSVVVAVFVGDVFDEQHEQDVVLVLAGIHAAAQFIAGGPEGGVEIGFLDGHELLRGVAPRFYQSAICSSNSFTCWTRILDSLSMISSAKDDRDVAFFRLCN